MKRLSKLFRSLIGTIVVATGLLCVYALPSGAFNNLSTTGNANQTGGGGGGGSVGTLQQVTDAGNTTNDPIFLTGSDTSTFAGPVSSTRHVIGAGSSGLPSLAFAENPTNGLFLNATNYPQLKGTTGLQMSAGGSLYQYNSAAFYPDTNNARTLGDSTHYWSTIYGTTILGTTVSSSLHSAPAGSSSAPTYNFCGAGYCNTGIYSDFDQSLAIAGGGVRNIVVRSTGVFVGTNVMPFVDNTTDFGTSALRFNDIFLGGTLTAGSVFASTTAGSALPSLVVTGTTKFINSSSTFFLSGASALVSDTAPIPTSTSVTVNGIPNQFYAFNATTTNCVYWTPGTLRGAWDATTITPTVSWTSASGSGDVVWRLRAQSLADGTNLGSTFTGEASYATGTFSLAYFRDVIPMTTLTVQNAAAYVPIRWELCREAGNSGDTFGGDAYAEMVMGKYYATNQSD